MTLEDDCQSPNEDIAATPDPSGRERGAREGLAALRSIPRHPVPEVTSTYLVRA